MDMFQGKRVATYRKQAGLSQQELADAVGLSLEYIRRIELNRHPNVRRKWIDAMAKVLGVDWQAFFDDGEDRYSAESEDIQMARRIVGIVPDIKLDNPVEFMRRMSLLEEDHQELIDAIVKVVHTLEKRRRPKQLVHRKRQYVDRSEPKKQAHIVGTETGDQEPDVMRG